MKLTVILRVNEISVLKRFHGNILFIWRIEKDKCNWIDENGEGGAV